MFFILRHGKNTVNNVLTGVNPVTVSSAIPSFSVLIYPYLNFFLIALKTNIFYSIDKTIETELYGHIINYPLQFELKYIHQHQESLNNNIYLQYEFS